MLQALLIILIASQISCHPLNTRFVLGATNATIEHIARCALRKNSTNIHLDRARCVLESYPLIDGHNDLAALYGIFANDSVYSVDLNSDMSFVWNHSYSRVDIPKLRMGLLGGQFWSCWVPCDAQYRDAVRMTLEQLDVIKRFINYYPGTFQFVDTSDDVLKSFHAGKIASMIGLEGGHSIDSSLGALRMYYELGVRYMTVTHSCNTPWADNWMVDEPTYNGTVLNGLTPFGKTVILEMNRLGMIVDLAHVAKKTMLDVLNVTRAPVLFTHSSVFSLCNHHRNVQDDVLLKTKANGGVVMVNFYTFFVTCSPNYKTEATLSDVADHIEYIKDLIGVDHVGIGSDYDGADMFPVGLENVSFYPELFAELVERGWSDIDLQKLAGRNVIRVFHEVEKVRDSMKSIDPIEDHLDPSEQVDRKCRTTWY